MKKVISLIVLSMLASGYAHAEGSSEVVWFEPENYRDIRPAQETRKAYRKRVFAQLEKHIQSLAEDLPEGYYLHMKVTDLDLAGEVLPPSFSGISQSGLTGNSHIRTVKRMYYPRIDFEFSLKDAQGSVVKEGQVSLKDMAFMDKITRGFTNDSLRYDKALISRWFDDEMGALTKAD